MTVVAVLGLLGTALALTPSDVSMGTAGSAGTRTVDPTPQWLAAARGALVRELRHAGEPAVLAPVRGGRLRASAATATGSYNWSGYVDTAATAGSFTGVTARWTTPAISPCTAEDTITAEWVGLDGWGDTTVEQDGTLEWCFEGLTSYFTWYEMYPAGTVTVGTTLRPGDKISAQVARAGSSYTLSLTDSTTPANSFTQTATCAPTVCADTSAEWVMERPAFLTTGMPPLADYGTWTPTNAMVREGSVLGSISSYSPVEITMVDSTGTYSLSTPSTLNAAGNSFTTTWGNSY